MAKWCGASAVWIAYPGV